MKQTHILKLPNRTGMAEVIEEPTRIVLNLSFDKVGDFGDKTQILNWMQSIIEKYDDDERPFCMVDRKTGESATVGFDYVLFAPPQTNPDPSPQT
jgi:hypothetical protein